MPTQHFLSLLTLLASALLWAVGCAGLLLPATDTLGVILHLLAYLVLGIAVGLWFLGVGMLASSVRR